MYNRPSTCKALIIRAISFAAAVLPVTVMVQPMAVRANEYAPALKRLVEERIRPMLQEAIVVETLRDQNARHAGLAQLDIDRLDQDWRAQAEHGGALVDELLNRPLSVRLKDTQETSDGLFSEIFIMDNRGLNAGQSGVTSDYWQGDEDKWQKTFSIGRDAIFVDEIDFDDSTGSFLAQVSTTITDPGSGDPIGAITVGINVEKLPD